MIYEMSHNQDTLRILLHLLQSGVVVWLTRISIPGLRCFYTTNRISVSLPDPIKVLTDDLSPNP